MLRFPNCKINLGLYITNRRDDGFHDLETIFYPVPLHDTLEIVRAKEDTTLHITGREVAGKSDENLVWRAYKLLERLFPGKVMPLDIYLNKTLPMGAGLGGGSADGACMLQLVNDLCKLGQTPEQLAILALQLGSDCPFFIYNTPRLAKGRGELLEPLSIDLSGYSLQLICPGVHISTAKAFGMITPKPAAFDLSTLPALPIADWKEHISNDFEEPVFAQHRELQQIKDQLYTQGAVYASMSGSGSAIYGLFYKKQKAIIDTQMPFESFYIE